MFRYISKIEEAGDRSYIWRTLADHVNLGRVSPKDFLECVFNNIISENIELSV